MISEEEQRRILKEAENDCYNSIGGKITIGKFCKRLFDGYMCWPETEAGTLALQNCTQEYLKAIGKGFASKQCESNGEWALGADNVPWTNYSQCLPFYFEKFIPHEGHDFYKQWLPIIKSTTHVGYTFSIISLLFALIVFISIKRLHCARNYLHMNLFASFIIRSVMSILKDILFVKGTALMDGMTYDHGDIIFKEDNTWICKAIVSIRKYFINSNYMMLLMEGIYLHNLMFWNLFSDHNSVLVYCVAGWALPAVFIMPWIALKATYENKYCWTQKSSKFISLLLDAPIGISILINFILFIIIVRVLFVKLNAMYIQQRRIKYRKLLRSTLILMPLFGIPYVVTLILYFYIKENKTLEIIFVFLDQSFTAFQGFLTVLVYCIFNSEVQYELKRKYRSFKDKNNKEFRRSRTISHTQQSSIPINDDPLQDICERKFFETALKEITKGKKNKQRSSSANSTAM